MARMGGVLWCVEGAGWETEGKEIHLEDLDVNGWLILKWIRKLERCGLD
jgi:hypothetical protein